MKTIIKKILLETMSYLNTGKFNDNDIYLKKAYEETGREILITRLGRLFSWLDPRDHLAFENLQRYIIYKDYMEPEDFSEVYQEFLILFKVLPELTEIFVLKEQHVEFNASLTAADIQEMYDFVETNYVINPLHKTRYIRYNKE
jgi:hypothetical protein